MNKNSGGIFLFSDKFIYAAPEYNDLTKFVPAPYFRKSFEVENTGEPCSITIGCGGFYRIWINGTEITKGIIAPYISNLDHTVYFDKYDLTGYLVKGKNTLGFMLGNGMQNNPGGKTWKFHISRLRSAPRFAFSIEIGESVIEADESVRTAPSPLYFDDLRCGERYDARNEINGWNLPSFDDSDWNNAILCEKKNWIYKGTAKIVMPENYIALFDAPDEETAKRIVKAASRPITKAGNYILQGGNLPKAKISPKDKIKSGPVNTLFYRLYVKAKKFCTTESCTGCGLCESLCPMNNISVKDGTPVWGKNCTHCMACICGCPMEAIEYGKVSVGKPRYKCPNE